MNIIGKIPKFTFYYVLPMSLGFATGLAIKDSQILGNRRKISMSVFSYYNNIEEKIPNHLLKVFPDLEYLSSKSDKQKSEKLES